jgi:hypothetical protein
MTLPVPPGRRRAAACSSAASSRAARHHGLGEHRCGSDQLEQREGEKQDLGLHCPVIVAGSGRLRGMHADLWLGSAFMLVSGLGSAVCKSVARASKVRILHLPPSVRSVLASGNAGAAASPSSVGDGTSRAEVMRTWLGALGLWSFGGETRWLGHYRSAGKERGSSTGASEPRSLSAFLSVVAGLSRDHRIEPLRRQHRRFRPTR